MNLLIALTFISLFRRSIYIRNPGQTSQWAGFRMGLAGSRNRMTGPHDLTIGKCSGQLSFDAIVVLLEI
jgi:hypothetical protein